MKIKHTFEHTLDGTYDCLWAQFIKGTWTLVSMTLITGRTA